MVNKNRNNEPTAVFISFRRCIFFLSLLLLSSACPGQPVQVTARFQWDDAQNKKTHVLGDVAVTVIAAGQQNQTVTTDVTGLATFNFVGNPGKLEFLISLQNKEFKYMGRCDSSKVTILEGFYTPPTTPPSGVVEIDLGKHDVTGIWSELSEAHSKLSVNARFDMPQIDLCKCVDGDASCKTAFRPREFRIRFRSSQINSPYVLNHEYGHAVMQVALRSQLAPKKCSNHGKGKETTASCAMVEGWADFFALYMLANRDNPTQFELSEYYCSDVQKDKGYLDEGRVMAALWDFYDTHDDDAIGNGDRCGAVFKRDKNSSYPIEMSDLIDNLNQDNMRCMFTSLMESEYITATAKSFLTEISLYNYIIPYDSYKDCLIP